MLCLRVWLLCSSLLFREFDLAEIEYFVHPDRKDNFDKFCNVADLTPFLYSQDIQLSGEPPLKITLREAVEKVRCNT